MAMFPRVMTGLYSQNLINRPGCEDILPILKASPFNLRKGRSEYVTTHAFDLLFEVTDMHPVGEKPKPLSYWFIIFTIESIHGSDDLQGEQDHTAIGRIKALLDMEEDDPFNKKRCAILYLNAGKEKLAPGINGYHDAQTMLQNNHIKLPLLYVNTAEDIRWVIGSFMGGILKPAPPKFKQVDGHIFEALAMMTVYPKLGKEAVKALTIYCKSLAEVAALTERDRSGLEDVGLTKEEIDGILTFWKQEWILE